MHPHSLPCILIAACVRTVNDRLPRSSLTPLAPLATFSCGIFSLPRRNAWVRTAEEMLGKPLDAAGGAQAREAATRTHGLKAGNPGV